MGLTMAARRPRALALALALLVAAAAAEEGCKNACSGHGNCVRDRVCDTAVTKQMECAGGCNTEFASKPIEVCASKLPDGRCKASSPDDCKVKCESRQNCQDFYFEAVDDGPHGVCTMCRDCQQ